MTLFWHPTGPLVRFDFTSGLLHVEDLNPEVKTQWRMSRSELLRLGWKCIVAAVRA